MTSRQQNHKRQQQKQQQSKRKETLCQRMAGFLKALGLENKPEYAEKIPDTLTDQDFQVHDTFHHGFPSQPSCLAYDPVQKILAVATKHGTVVLLGKPGLEGSFTHPETCCVSQMVFIANKSTLVTSCDNRTLYQWSIADKQPTIRHQLQFTKECPTAMSWTYGSEWLYVGNDASNVHLVHVDNFTLSGYVIHWNNVVDG
ncbi:Syntaxin-binding protein 5-like [Geodia barretti]|jgi:syntaxin-binding protein 5|nr:Syntaxin-binding protein 5-like [Geodia barretti]